MQNGNTFFSVACRIQERKLLILSQTCLFVKIIKADIAYLENLFLELENGKLLLILLPLKSEFPEPRVSEIFVSFTIDFNTLFFGLKYFVRSHSL